MPPVDGHLQVRLGEDVLVGSSTAWCRGCWPAAVRLAVSLASLVTMPVPLSCAKPLAPARRHGHVRTY
nr:unnamed protein product [Digitaria exilis]